ncbi:MAG: ATP-grasp domain-containing protein, partial [Chitinophagaceae bacterium]
RSYYMIQWCCLNLLDYQLCPAALNEKTLEEATLIAKNLISKFKSPGVFAIEMFVSNTGEVLVNETAPRVHNSGHHTIEATLSSQFDMLWRILLKMPLGSTQLLSPSVMVNIIGAEFHQGPVEYEGLPEVLSQSGAFVHLYGKQKTSPGRKMGHVNLLGQELTMLDEKAHWIKSTLIAKSSTKE